MSYIENLVTDGLRVNCPVSVWQDITKHFNTFDHSDYNANQKAIYGGGKSKTSLETHVRLKDMGVPSGLVSMKKEIHADIVFEIKKDDQDDDQDTDSDQDTVVDEDNTQKDVVSEDMWNYFLDNVDKNPKIRGLANSQKKRTSRSKNQKREKDQKRKTKRA